MDYVEAIGMVAAVLTTAAFLPQVFHTYKTKDVSGLSYPMLFMFVTGIALWLLYGFLLGSPSLIFANSVTIISVGFLVYFKWLYGKNSD